MKPDELKTAASALKELNEGYVDLLQAVKGAVKEVKTAKQLWRDGNRSKLVKFGLALIVFPEPTLISDAVGSFLVATGTIQEGIRRRALYIEDIPKALYSLLKDLQEANRDL